MESVAFGVRALVKGGGIYGPEMEQTCTLPSVWDNININRRLPNGKCSVCRQGVYDSEMDQFCTLFSFWDAINKNLRLPHEKRNHSAI